MKKLVIVLPVHNEEIIIEKSLRKLISFLKKNKLGLNWEIVVAENGSTDKTVPILKKLSKTLPFSYIVLPARSRSAAIKQAWKKINADFYMFMDADLSTDIRALKPLSKYLVSDYDVVIGSRRIKGAKTSRGFIRKFISFAFFIFINLIFPIGVKDFQCGFKAISRKVRNHLIPQMKYVDEGFMDTELVAVAHSKGYKIKEMPVKWNDDRPSKFNIFRAMYLAILNSIRIKRDIIRKKYH